MTRILIRTLRAFSNTRLVMVASVMLLLLAVISAPAIRNAASEAADGSRANFPWFAPPMLTAPTNLTVSFASSNGITLNWEGSWGGTVDHYEIERSESASEPFVLIGNTRSGEATYSDNSVVNQHAYLYRVRGVQMVQTQQPPECSSAFSDYSNMALGTAISFEFAPPEDLKNKPIKARHITDVRTAINAVRKAANLSPAIWLRDPVQNLEIKAQDIQEMRDRLGEALATLNISVAAYQDPTLATGPNGTPISAIHIEQLQTRATSGSSSGSGRPPQLSDRAKLGEFVTATGTPLPFVPVHMNLLPDGRILFWGRDRFKINGSVIEQTGQSQACVWNPVTNEIVEVDNHTTNLFCSGHSFLPDGRLLVSGGHRDAKADGDGEPHLNIFDFRSIGSTMNNSWVRAQQDMTNGRWYPYNVMLGNGKTLILSGSYFKTLGDSNSKEFNSVPEIYNSDNGRLETLPDPAPSPTPPPSPAPSPTPPFFSYYPYVELRPDGQVLQIQSPALKLGSDRRSRLFNPNSNTWSDAPSTNDDHGSGSAVLFDSGNKALVVGGFTIVGEQPNTQAEYLDLKTGGAWTRIASMNFKRAYNTATILPDGKVLVTGGASCPGSNNVDCAERGALNAELWDATAFNPSQPTNVLWRIMARANEIRAYHSLAVLLPDATVLIAGGGRPGAVGEFNTNCTTNFLEADLKLFGHTRVEIYSPPYLFDVNGNLLTVRPEITSAPPSIFYGKSFSISTSGAGSNPQVSLVRLASVTHGFNQDQRQISLTPTAVNANGITVTGPPDSNKCPPGYYMLFVLNNGVPSKAKMVKVGSTSIFLTAAPETTAPGAGSTWEQGIEFSSSVNGEITHIRFWKADTEMGQHIGRIWDATTGQELREVTFTCETSSGWQQVALATPLPITAGVRYRVTYNVNVLVAKTFNVLNAPITVGPLTGWSSWFSTPAGTFPTTVSGSNLFADVVFRQTQ